MVDKRGRGEVYLATPETRDIGKRHAHGIETEEEHIKRETEGTVRGERKTAETADNRQRGGTLRRGHIAREDIAERETLADNMSTDCYII